MAFRLWLWLIDIIFLNFAAIKDRWCSLEPPEGGWSNGYSQLYVSEPK